MDTMVPADVIGISVMGFKTSNSFIGNSVGSDVEQSFNPCHFVAAPIILVGAMEFHFFDPCKAA